MWSDSQVMGALGTAMFAHRRDDKDEDNKVIDLTFKRVVAANYSHPSTKIAVDCPESENELFPKIGA